MIRRRVGEAIVVAGDVEIEVMEISRSRIKLGIRAPGSVTVTRREALPVARENRLAVGLIGEGGPEAVDELLQLLQPVTQAGDTPEPVSGPAPPPGRDSTNAAGGRYGTTDQYCGYRVNGENPRPA